MTGSMTVPREVEEYLAAVHDALADLPAAERDDLPLEVEASLADAAAESGGALAARLGEPEAFAAELRSAAGLHEAPRAERQPSAAAQRARALLGRFLSDPRVGSARRLGHELAQVWWAARGYVLVGGLAYLLTGTGRSATSRWPLRRRRSRRRRSRDSSTTACPLPTSTRFHGTGSCSATSSSMTAPGRPLEIPGDRLADSTRRFVVTNGNKPLFNVFPIRYYEPGTHRVARPNAAPYVELPLVRTPPSREEPGDSAS